MCTDVQRTMVRSALQSATARCIRARSLVWGMRVPGGVGNPQSAADAVAQRVFGIPDPDPDKIAAILDLMVLKLQRLGLPGRPPDLPDLPLVDCCGPNDAACGSRDGYVLMAQPQKGYVTTALPQIHLCPSFFTSSYEQRVRTLTHEAAHLAGIGSAFDEEYLGAYDGQTAGMGGLGSADAWAHYVHIVSGQTPDTATGTGLRRRAPGASAAPTHAVPAPSPRTPICTR